MVFDSTVSLLQKISYVVQEYKGEIMKYVHMSFFTCTILHSHHMTQLSPDYGVYSPSLIQYQSKLQFLC